MTMMLKWIPMIIVVTVFCIILFVIIEIYRRKLERKENETRNI